MRMFSRGPAARRLTLALVALLLVFLIGFAGAQVLVAASPPLVAPLVAPAGTSSPIPPSVEVLPALPSAPHATDQTTAPGPAQPTSQPVVPAAVTPAPAVTAAPRPTVPVAPPTTAAPSDDVHSIAPEPGMPGYSPPPGRD